ncbi:MAG: hypothetical protein EB015_12690 [Methylocystaceae bacterium]|nr:hypothetical protein [Methylocystaceae bacterium]
MRAVLDDELWHSYQDQLEQARWEREMAETGKQMFAAYSRKLRVANMLYGRYEQLVARRSIKAHAFGIKVDGYYERAIEALQEGLAADRTAQAYIEADYSDDPNHNTIGLCPDGMPRLIYRADTIANRDQIKIRILTRAIADTDTHYGIGQFDPQIGETLTAEELSQRLHQARAENTEANTSKNKFDKRLPTFTKLFGE